MPKYSLGQRLLAAEYKISHESAEYRQIRSLVNSLKSQTAKSGFLFKNKAECEKNKQTNSKQFQAEKGLNISMIRET